MIFMTPMLFLSQLIPKDPWFQHTFWTASLLIAIFERRLTPTHLYLQVMSPLGRSRPYDPHSEFVA